jgi:hypothetical protein
VSSVTSEKSSRNCPTAKKSFEVYRRTTSSASLSMRTSDDGGQTAIATATFLGFRARTERIADSIDDPVAIPSSTMMTIRPAESAAVRAACTAPVSCGGFRTGCELLRAGTRPTRSLWGAPRIHGELRALGFDVSERTVSRLLERLSHPPSQTSRTFLTNHLASAASMDFLWTQPHLWVERSVEVGCTCALRSTDRSPSDHGGCRCGGT